jgi:thioredoxin-like negative regulator of GroEL
VSQIINLASLYNDMGKPKEARQVITEMSAENASSFGNMQATIERLAAADQLGDSAEVEKKLGFLREHKDDSLSTYQRALVSANRSDDAAKLLISRLQDPDQRMDALMEVQKYEFPPLPKRAALWHKRWLAVLARPDVIDAINKVGVVSAYTMTPEPH